MISVIVPVYNGEKIVGQCLKSLLNQNYPKKKYEIIVVDDGSTDNTKKVVQKIKRVRLLEQKHRGPAVARNLGVRYAKGDVILFTDADCIPSKNWIKNMIEPFKDERIVGVSGAYKTLNKNSLIARFSGYEIEGRHEKLREEKEIDFIGTYSAGYRKNIFLKFGGFDENFPIASGEDTELSFKISEARFKMVFQPKAFVYHRHPDTLFKFLKQKFWRGYWRIPLYKKHTGKIFRHSYTPKSLYIEIGILMLAIVFFSLGLLKLMSTIFGLLLFLLSFLLTLPFSFKILKKDKQVGLVSPFIIILRNLSIGLGIIFGSLKLLR